MLKYIFNDKLLNTITNKITQSVQKSFDKYHAENQDSFDNLGLKLDTLRLELKSLDERLTRKELKDRAEYGHVQYKLSSLQNEVITKSSDKKKSVN